jgi:hypothetical protein
VVFISKEKEKTGNKIKKKKGHHSYGIMGGLLLTSFHLVLVLKHISGGGEVSGGGTHYM